jgi:antitoxin component of MazEF toxin-antitoxin module
MTKTISKIGNSQGLIFDGPLMDLSRLKVGDQVDVVVSPGSGAIILTPLRPAPSPEVIQKTIKKTMRDYANTMKKLA